MGPGFCISQNPANCSMGDIKPHKDVIQQNLSNLVDEYDEQDEDPEPHYFDTNSSTTVKVSSADKGSVP
jgi:hypothetical protein